MRDDLLRAHAGVEREGEDGVLRLELTVDTDNARALALYRKFGFQIEGTLRGYALGDGHYADVFTMARFHPDAHCD